MFPKDLPKKNLWGFLVQDFYRPDAIPVIPVISVSNTEVSVIQIKLLKNVTLPTGSRQQRLTL